MSALGPDDIGHRVVVRRRLSSDPAGHRFTDVLGVLQRYDETGLEVRRVDATVEGVSHGDVTAAKTIPAMPLRPVDVDALLLATALGRPAAETAHLGEWLLRASSGWTGRANSLLPIGSPGVGVPEALSRAESFYAERGLPPLALVVLGSAAEEAIRGAGWVEARPTQADTMVMHTTLDLVNASPDLSVAVEERPTGEWYAVAFDHGPVPAVASVVMEGAPRGAFASVWIDGRIVAVARGALTGHWLGVDAVNVLSPYRRRGLGTALLRALARWAGALNARRTYLEVVSDNAPAVAAYQALGYREAYRYRYLTPPR